MAKKRAEQMKNKKEEKVESKDEAAISAFGQIINASCVVTMQPGDEVVRLPVSWVSQASFVPPGVMLAVHTENLDNFLTTDVEEQMAELFKKYDADDSGMLDKEETMFMLDELLGSTPGSLDSEFFAKQKEEAWALLDDDASGEVDVDELAAAARDGPLAEMIAQQRRIASLETLLGKAEDHVKFTLSTIPQGTTTKEAMEADLVKPKKCKNGLPAVKGATAYIECTVEKAIRSGNCTLLYGLVNGGEVLDDGERTQLVTTNHIETEEQDGKGADAEAEKELAMA
jgi:flavin reductase (DIM6/NTAB) family NADH-FMN oxidoreductase RutF